MEEQRNMIENEKHFKFVAYVCFVMAGLSILRLISLPGFVASAIIIFFSAAWYQAGVGIIKRRKYSKWLAGSLLFVSLIPLTWVVVSVFDTLLKENSHITGYVHLVYFAMWLVNLTSLYFLFKKRVAKR